MALPGQRVTPTEDKLEDRISVGVLAKAFPRTLVEEVIGKANAKHGVSVGPPCFNRTHSLSLLPQTQN